MNQINVERLCGALSKAKPGDIIRLKDHEANLPESMDIPMPDFPIDELEMEVYINDQLSNRTGWCVNSYNYCTTKNTIHVTNIDWDTSD